MIDRAPPLLARLLGIADIEELGEAWSTRPITHCCSEDLGEYAFAGLELAEVVSADAIPASSARRLRFEDCRQYSDTFTRPRIGTDDIVAAVEAGDSVMIRGIDAFSRIALLLARRLSLDLGCRVLPNLFVSPAFGTALGQHADPEATVYLQLSGHKAWRVFSPDDEAPRKVGSTAATRVVDEVRLRPGAALFVPAYFPHEVRTCGGGFSVSMSLAIIPWALHQIVEVLVDAGEAEGLWSREEFQLLPGVTIPRDDIGHWTDGRFNRIAEATLDLKHGVWPSLAGTVLRRYL